jgi:hypothetical protein
VLVLLPVLSFFLSRSGLIVEDDPFTAPAVAEAEAPKDGVSTPVAVNQAAAAVVTPKPVIAAATTIAAAPLAEPSSALEAPQPEDETTLAAAVPQAAEPSLDPKFDAELKRIRALLSRGIPQRQQALDLARRLGEKHPDEPEVLELWSKAAASVKWWGESLRIAIRWASVDPNEASHLHLARTQRLVGQKFGAIQTLERFLEQAPESKPALSALQQYKNER